MSYPFSAENLAMDSVEGTREKGRRREEKEKKRVIEESVKRRDLGKVGPPGRRTGGTRGRYKGRK